MQWRQCPKALAKTTPSWRRSQRFWRNVDGVETEFLTADEIENLSIRAGTLTLAERDIINHHIVATINMLEQLPWPKHLKNVPEYAGAHHERMDGKRVIPKV